MSHLNACSGLSIITCSPCFPVVQLVTPQHSAYLALLLFCLMPLKQCSSSQDHTRPIFHSPWPLCPAELWCCSSSLSRQVSSNMANWIFSLPSGPSAYFLECSLLTNSMTLPYKTFSYNLETFRHCFSYHSPRHFSVCYIIPSSDCESTRVWTCLGYSVFTAPRTVPGWRV